MCIAKKLFLMCSVAILAGCTSQAGPFVTNISSDGQGNLVVEKCMVELQRQISTVQNTNCTNTTIALGAKPR